MEQGKITACLQNDDDNNVQDHCDWPAIAKCKFNEEENYPGEQEEGSGKSVDEVIEPVHIAENITVPDTGKKVICYFTNWAVYRQGPARFLPEDVDYTLCTHINYGFAVLDPDSLEMVPHDAYVDVEKAFYKDIVSFKSKGVKVLIALGGWNDSENDKYSRLVVDRKKRENFVASAVKFIQEWGFDGLDLDWEYPKCWQVDCSKGPDSDKVGFSALVKELSEAMRPLDLILSAAVSPSKAVIDQAYDVPVLNDHLDIINVMTYDYHGYWDRLTGHVSPLYSAESGDNFNTNFSLNYWAQLGADKEKLILGLPFYGQTFSLASPAEAGLGAAVIGRGEAGEFTRAGGFLAFYEICRKIKSESWSVRRDTDLSQGPYASSGDQWVSYDDMSMVRIKAEYVIENGFGGAMIWALDLDDYSGMCGCGQYPLLKTVNRVLREYPVAEPQCDL